MAAGQRQGTAAPPLAVALGLLAVAQVFDSMCVVSKLWSLLKMIPYVKLATHVILSSPVLIALPKEVPPSGSPLYVRNSSVIPLNYAEVLLNPAFP
ncbi:hypothetical protein BTVI_46000 [Pitangus sulphuratus]|nr:hypothetical protein BTVI_46000 [Pitangus sulphuratus]